MEELFLVLNLLANPAPPTAYYSPTYTIRFAQAVICIPEPEKLTFGEKASDDWVKQCEQQFRNPMPTCHKLYSLPSDRELCLRAIEKIDEYHKQKPTHKTRNDFKELKK